MNSVRHVVATAYRGSDPPLRVCPDANVWISYLGAMSALRRGVPAALVEMIDNGDAGGIPLQLFISWELIDTIERVLVRLGVEHALATQFTAAIEGLMQAGPEALHPPLFLAGREQLAMQDREDAGVLASCFAHDVALLVTDNLVDFDLSAAERYDTQVVVRREGSMRKLFALVHKPVGHAELVVLHPIDALAWLRNGRRPTADEVRSVYSAPIA